MQNGPTGPEDEDYQSFPEWEDSESSSSDGDEGEASEPEEDRSQPGEKSPSHKSSPPEPSRDQQEQQQRNQQERKKEILSKAEDHVYGPALALIIVGGISLAIRVIWLGIRILTVITGDPLASMDAGSEAERVGRQVGFYGGFVFTFLAPLIDGLVIFGAVQMMNLRNKALGMTAAVISCIPCCSPLCLFGIPFGIWAIVALSKDVVKEGFRMKGN